MNFKNNTNLNYSFISFATNDDKYLNYLNRLLKILDEKKLSYDFELINKNNNLKKYNICLYKSEFILNKLLDLKKTIIWVDIDSLIFDNVDLNFLNNEFDVGLVFTPKRKHIITDAIHVYKYNPNSIIFLEFWNELNQNIKLNSIDHVRLDYTVQYFLYENSINIKDIHNDIFKWFCAVFSRNNQKLFF